MQTYGVYSTWAGGFIDLDLGHEEALQALERWVGEGEERDELSVLLLCSEHEGQPAYGCEECDREEDDEED